MADVTIKYKGANIATMDASGTKTLETGGKYCEGDVQVVYADPEKPTQSKTVTPTASGFTVSPDSGKVLSSVVVNGDADLIASNIRSGKNIFGVDGTLVEGITPSGNKSITATTATQTGIDVTDYATVSVAPTPSETKSTTVNGDVTPSNGKLLSKVTVNVPTGTARSASDLTVSGATVTVPAGLYSAQATKSVASGSAGTPSASKGTVSNNSVTVTPSVTNTTGYITGGTKTGTGVTVSASELVSGNKALTPSTTAQTNIDVRNYATASVSAITKELLASLDSDFVAENIKKDVDLFGLLGTLDGGGGGGGGSVHALSKGVNFIDYDGTVVATWETSTVASKTALPDNPTHDGLTAQGWNWTLAEIQSYIATYPNALVVVGQMYITNDGKTRIYIHLEEGRLSPYLGICPNGSVDIDWGDGSAHDTVTGTSVSTVVNTQHTYDHGGDYLIALTVTGTMGIVGTSSYGSHLLWRNSTTKKLNIVYQNSVKKVEIGSRTSIGTYAFKSCYGLASVTIPNSVTSIGSNAFYDCYGLTSVTIPNSVTSIGTAAFYNCYGLTSVAIPNSVTSIGSYAFYDCYGLTSVTIPNSVTSIGTYEFYDCYGLTSVAIPNSVTSIGTYAFYDCCGLTSVTIPNSVTSIGTVVFNSCYGLGFIKFTRQTPPTVSNSNAWANVPTDCVIYVPAGTLSAYTSATNYPSPSTYTYVEY